MTLIQSLNQLVILENDLDIEQKVWEITQQYNVDNISRTEAYGQFYSLCKDIKWAFLASMVSRNAGWNITDLYNPAFSSWLTVDNRESLCKTYERANWLIFRDAFPQLLLYYYWTVTKRLKLHLLPLFYVSSFMVRQWELYINNSNSDLLTYSLITNEQNVIEDTVVQHPFYKKKVFGTVMYTLQEWNHFTFVLFPTLTGQLYGANVKGFRSISNRIMFGKQLYSILFHRDLYNYFWEFHLKVPPTGTRLDYLFFCPWKETYTLPLRCYVPIMGHHVKEESNWSNFRTPQKGWSQRPPKMPTISMTNLYRKKRQEIEMLASIHEWWKRY
ncbi:DUF2515 family protein [Mangrovibacillus cuniculi]|uniref:DUF2515 family protein n=1 Tax=Mangrovibacillus cuniculi TaxID=2593652 RepID=A0A7S8CBB6_9BACI|nr:DUF2515 family protein [Mangrovibacillus cuniculi]QPC46663.1 DUF2515 family protein [Mangrovibacillus cuniculi]